MVQGQDVPTVSRNQERVANKMLSSAKVKMKECFKGSFQSFLSFMEKFT